MNRTAALVTDMMTRARLHAALDAVINTQEMIEQIHESSMASVPTVNRLGSLVAEARELLGRLLAVPASGPLFGQPATGSVRGR